MTHDSWREFVLSETEGEAPADIRTRTGIDLGTILQWLDPNPPDIPRLVVSWADARRFADGYQLPILKVVVQAGILTQEEVDQHVRSNLSAWTTQELAEALRKSSESSGPRNGR